MNDNMENLKGVPFNLENNVIYTDGSVVSQMLLKKSLRCCWLRKKKIIFPDWKKCMKGYI